MEETPRAVACNGTVLSSFEGILTDSGAGGHRASGSTSLSAIYATFVPTFITAVIYLSIFVCIRQSYRNVYVPRTYFTSVPKKDRTPVNNPGPFGWVRDLWSFDDRFVLRHQSLDGYLFLRFFKCIIFLSFVGCCITWPVLFPVNATGGGEATELDRISFSNVIGIDRLYAHVIVSWAFLTFVLVLIARERLFVITLRQAYLLLPINAKRLSSRVVLFLSVPGEALRDDGLTKVFGQAAKRCWTISNLDKLDTLIQDRNDKANALEAAEVELSRSATKKKFHGDSLIQSVAHVSSGQHEDDRPLEEQARPTHKSLPIVGNEVDTIKNLRTLLPELSTLIDGLRETESGAEKRGTPAMFVEFENPAAAHQACQEVHHHSRMTLWPRYVGVLPKETLWQNLTIHPSDRMSRSLLATIFIAATIILWSIPIGFIAAISNISYLTDKVHFLKPLNNLPDPVLGFLQGFVPPYVVSEVVSYVPKFFRKVAKAAGAPTTPAAERTTQQWYFAFQLIQVFLVTTSASGAAAVATKIANEPTSIPNLLAENLPKAANFYLSYFILQGTASAAKNILNYSDLFEYLFYDRFIDKTPRQQYLHYSRMKGLSWGSVYPKFGNMAVIAIAYSAIAPLMLGFSTIGFYLYYLSYRHNLVYVIQTKIDTKGAAYSLALQHILTGVYISELCLIGLFGARSAAGPTVLMVILLLGTIVYHIIFNRIVGPLEKYPPIQFASESAEREEQAPLLAAEEGHGQSTDPGNSPPHNTSLVLKYGQGKLPTSIIKPIARFLEPHAFYSPDDLKAWFHEPMRDSSSSEDLPTYTEDQLKNAYVNPGMTSKTPKLWLAKDRLGLSKREIEENEKVGITSTDEGATVDKDGNLSWDHEDWTNTPVWKEPVNY